MEDSPKSNPIPQDAPIKKWYSARQSTICHQSDERRRLLDSGERVINLAEYVADDRAEDQQNSNYDDCNQNKDQSILDQALAFFFRGE
jgi:hypothetical protein